jgi:hypothetical protein
MHSVHIAEWLLALVTTRDRAASTVGDLTEGAATRGGAWFWSGVLRTAASLLWRDVVEHPARLTGLALLAVAINIAIAVLFAILSIIGSAILVGAFMGAFHIGIRILPEVDSIGFKIWFTVPMVVGPLLVGRLLARWAPGRELAACLMYAILVSIYNLVPMLGGSGGFSALVCVLIVPAGAAWGRYRRLSARHPSSV